MSKLLGAVRDYWPDVERVEYISGSGGVVR